MTPDFKFDKIIWNENNIKKIMETSKSPEAANLLRKYGNVILSEAKPQLPEDQDKRYSKYTPLKQAFIVTEPKIKKAKYKGQSFESYMVQIKPQKNRKYYYVVMSGSNTYNGKKVKIKYSSPNAKAFIIESTTRKHNTFLQQDFMNLVFKKAGQTND